MNVWVVTINADYGMDNRVFRTEEGARKHIKKSLEIIENAYGYELEDDEKQDSAIGFEWFIEDDQYIFLSEELLQD